LGNTLFEGMQSSDWVDIIDYSQMQGIIALTFLAFEKCNVRLPMNEMMDWL